MAATMQTIRKFLPMIMVVLVYCTTDPTWGQSNLLKNGGFEEQVAESQYPQQWSTAQIDGLVFRCDAEKPNSGKHSLLFDTTAADLGGSNFVATSQRIDAKPFRGQTIRLSAFVKTEELGEGSAGQLWMRIDRESGETGGFDNMDDRPITSETWEENEITLKVDEDAQAIFAGLIVSGQGKVWMDDAALKVVEDKPTEKKGGFFSGSGKKPSGEKPKTGPPQNDDDKEPESKKSKTQETSSPSKEKTEEELAMEAQEKRNRLLMAARMNAGKSPKQPFFNHWLWLPLVALVLFGIAGLPDKETELLTNDETTPRLVSSHVAKFGFRFSCAYWLLYNLPFVLSQIIPKYGPQFYLWAQLKLEDYGQWVANNWLGIEGDLTPSFGNGSGDTTMAFTIVLIYFLAAIAIALIWTAVDWRKTNYANLKDLYRSYLRYGLAFWMLSYGLAKVAWDSNQFGIISEWQFNKTWGSSSPMNVVWSFMGASRPYTVFAGMGECIGGLLLIWRRTSTLGALVVVGVMTNVMMLNYCYDVPVKLFSTHLLVMAFCILIPDIRRLGSVLFFNRATKPVDFRPPYTNRFTIWVQRALKVAIIGIAVAKPLYDHTQRQVKYFQSQAETADFFGHYQVKEYRLDGKVKRQTSNMGWKSVRFGIVPEYTNEGFQSAKKMIIGMTKAQGQMSISFTNDEDPNILKVKTAMGGNLPKDEIKVEVLDEEQIKISGQTRSGLLEVTLKRNDNLYPVRDRGFRWINEVPFNN